MSIAERAEAPDETPAESAAGALFSGAERVAVGGDRPFLLSSDDAWFVAAGQVDVFTVRVSHARPVGPRTHLLRVGAGQALFGVGRPADAGWGLLAVGSNNTHLLRLRQAALGDGHGPAHLAPLVEPWIDALHAAMTRDKLPAISVVLEPGRAVEVAQATNVRARVDLAWVWHQEGYSRLMGRAGLEFGGDGCVPVSPRVWFEAGAPARLLALETHALASTEELWAGLRRLQELVLRYADVSDRVTEHAASERLRQKTVFREAILRDACERLAASMDGSGARAAALAAPGSQASPEDLDDPLFAACLLVGRAAGVTIKPHAHEQGAPRPRDPLAATLRASRVRSRQVALRERWWTAENGPLLGYLAADKRPVALLRPSASAPYVLHDPLERTERPLDAALAETLEPFAHSFYRPLPESRLGVRDVLRFAVHGCSRDAGMVVFTAVSTALLGMVPAMATGVLFSSVIPGAQRSQLVQMAVVLLACAFATSLFSLAQGIALLRIEGRAGSALQAAVWDRLLALPLGFFRPYTSGDLAVRAMSIESIRQMISGTTVSAMMGSVQALGNIALMFWYSWQMALWATLIIAVVIGVTLLGSYLQMRPQRAAMKLQSKAAGLVLQLLSSIAKIRVAGVEVQSFALWVRRFSEQRRLQYQSRSVSNWVTAFNAAVPLASYLLIFYVALPLITETRVLQTGDFMAFLTAFTSSSSAMISTSLALMASLNVIPLYEQAKPILETLPEVDPGKSDPGVLTGDIEVQHAMFRYQQDGPLVLRDVSFHVAPGEFAAFVGPSGSGKSTIMRLLLGFETLEAGAVYYDGQEIGGIDVHALRRQMGVVLQSGRLMPGDIFTNIAGASSASLDEAWEAARLSGLAEDIESMPMGMHTVLSEGGGTLSGGQRQRLLIARAIVSKPRILLFDEATSALDNRTQAIVSRSLESLQATRIVVAHRLSTILNADRIFVMERGRLVQAGSYAELMAQKGPFAELAKRQIA